MSWVSLFLKKYLTSKNLFIFLWLSIFSILFLLPVWLDWQSFWMDNNWLLDARESVVKYFSAWSDNLLGMPVTATYASLIYYFLNNLFFHLFWNNFWYFLLYFFIVFVIFLSGFITIRNFTKNDYYALWLSLAFVFNLSVLRFFYWQGTITFLLGIIWFLFTVWAVLNVYYKFWSHKKMYYIILFSSILVSHPFLFVFYSFILFLLLKFSLKERWKDLFILFTGIFLLNFFWIFQFLYAKTLTTDVFVSSYTNNLISVFSNASSLIYSAAFLWKNVDFLGEFFWNFYLLIGGGILILWILFFFILLKRKLDIFSKTLLFIILTLLLFSIGAKLPLWYFYDYLYSHLSFFSMFRSFSNVLLFACLLFYYFLIVNSKKHFYILLINVSFVVFFLASILIWNYSKNSKIPQEYISMKKLIDAWSLNGNILILPCSTYDYYRWDTGKQDKYFLEALFQKNWVLFFRPTLSDYWPIQWLFPRVCNSSISFSEVDKYDIDYILYRKDLLYEDKGFYNKQYFIFTWNSTLLMQTNNIELYKINRNKLNILKKQTSDLYYIALNIKETKELIFEKSFNQNRYLYINKFNDWDKSLIKNITKTFYEKPIFEETHHLVNDYANGRTLDADYIKKNFPKDYYKENPDGSIDVNLTLYFKPQSYFYLWLGVSGLTFFWLIAWLLVDRRRQKNLVQQTSAWTKNLH